MRYQRRAHRGSRPEGLGHPKPTLYTAESYRAKYVRPGPSASLYRLMRNCTLSGLTSRDGSRMLIVPRASAALRGGDDR